MENFAEENCISLICNGEFDALPGYPIGELFEDFFDNINYNVIKENDIYVDFTGDATCDGEPCTVLIRFKVESDLENFEIAEVKVNDDKLEEEEILDLLEDIAYTAGAIIEDDQSCSGEDCEHCSEHHNCLEENDDDEYDDLDDDYNDDDFDDDNDDDDDDIDDDNDDDYKK